MLIDAFHAALEDTEIAFGIVDMDFCIFSIHVFLSAVNDTAVLCKVLVHTPVVLGLIRHDFGFLCNVGLQDRHDSRGLEVIDNHALAPP